MHASNTVVTEHHTNPCVLHVQDECRTWDVNEVVFTQVLWPTYHQLMRCDFRLFDEYVFEHEGGSDAVGWPSAPRVLAMN